MNTMKMKIALVPVLIVSAFLASGCGLLKKKVETKESVEFKVNGNSKKILRIENVNGDVVVEKSPDTLGYVMIRATKILNVPKEDKGKPIDGIKINLDTTGDKIKLTADLERVRAFFGLTTKSEGKVNYEVTVPQNIGVDISTINGFVTTRDLSNDSRINVTNGGVLIGRCRGNTDIKVTNGFVNGNLDSSLGLKVNITNGTMKLGGLMSVSAELSASVTNGSVKNDGINFASISQEKKDLSGKIGDGKYRIDLSTTNGSIKLSGQEISLKKEVRFDSEGIHFDMDFDDNDNDKSDDSFFKDKNKHETPVAKDSNKVK